MKMTPGEFFDELIDCKTHFIFTNMNTLKKEDVFLIINNITNLCDIILEAKRRNFFEKNDYEELSFEITKKLEKLVDHSHLFYHDARENYTLIQNALNLWITEKLLLSKQSQ